MSLKEHILDENLMILASAGSGKTYQLGGRIIGMIGVHDLKPERMVALTFTRKAAGEFIDSVLIKLAKGTLDAEAGKMLAADVNNTFAVEPVLEKVVKALPRFQLGTIDSFFSRIVRGFQHELGISGGNFDLMEGSRLKLAMGELVQQVLGELLDDDAGQEFVHAFRRATMGREQLNVLSDLEDFINQWHVFWKTGNCLERFGGKGTFTNLPDIGRWESEKHQLSGALRAALNESMGSDDWTDKRQKPAVEKLVDVIEEHTIGSGLLTASKGLFHQLVERVSEDDPFVFKYYKEFELSVEVAALFGESIRLVSACELAAAVQRTEGLGVLIKKVDEECQRRFRSRGLLSFDDVKNLLGEWRMSEKGRLMREAVDFRLDGRYDHWFLDEFQDTSQLEWDGLLPLLQEAVSGEEGSLFVVGDKKQAIYGWRGGNVHLFDTVKDHFQRGMTVETMEESWRSCPAVLDLINRACGNISLVQQLFGKAVARRWEWKDHVSAYPDQSGEARVEVADKEEINALLVERLHELGIGTKKLSCGVLLRTGNQVREVVDYLKMEGFNVIEEGRREPMTDSPIGVAIHGLIRWLADPADRFATELIKMSPLAAVLEQRFGKEWYSRWEDLLKAAHSGGYAALVEVLAAPLWDSLSEFARHRVGDIVQALEQYDSSNLGTARGARDWLSELDIGQAPGEAAVQVMTIHKAKGLGFDVVMIPHLSDDQIPNRKNYKVAQGKTGWFLQPPPHWVRQLTPELAKAEMEWQEDERYEALCLLYVALTRAKRGLYVFLSREPEKRIDKEQRASLANLVRMGVVDDDEFQSGNSGWAKAIDDKEKAPEVKGAVQLGDAVSLRARMTPSASKTSDVTNSGSGTGMQVGSEVHQLFEQISWLDVGEIPRMPRSRPGMIVEETLADPGIHRIFEKGSGDIELFREQSVEVIQDGKWLSGIVDRMHIWRGDDGVPMQITIIDYKTDSATPEEITAKYTGQMRCYQKALVDIFGIGTEQVKCLIISTRNKVVVDLS
jgi:ATP-dependent helicase/nuclease subunit A